MTVPSPPDNFGVPTPNPYPYQGAPMWPEKIGQQPEGMPLHACMGLNSCKGSDRFGIYGPNGNNPNECAGQGYCATSGYGGTNEAHNCHVQNDCRNQGGCGLYGTAEEMDVPGANSCRSLGSCATPINAERFITTGPRRGESVWKRAREVFRTQVYPALRLEIMDANSELKPPEELGEVPELFRENGPAYLWISNGNTARGNMTACGQSNMSGAGGCA